MIVSINFNSLWLPTFDKYIASILNTDTANVCMKEFADSTHILRYVFLLYIITKCPFTVLLCGVAYKSRFLN